MSYRVKNAIILAAGLSSRFCPISLETPKALLTVKGEILIERQIQQLKSKGIEEIVVVVGYKSEKFQYLKDKYNVILIKNDEYASRNNNSSIYAVRDYLSNTYICSADNYFVTNLFNKFEECSFYSCLYAEGKTSEWCVEEDENGFISNVTIGGENAWYMNGHAFWDENFSKKFIKLINIEYLNENSKSKFWEDIFIEYSADLSMKTKKYEKNTVFEFDTLDELREFDGFYLNESNSKYMIQLCNHFKCSQSELSKFTPNFKKNVISGFSFFYKNIEYNFNLFKESIEEKI